MYNELRCDMIIIIVYRDIDYRHKTYVELNIDVGLFVWFYPAISKISFM